MTRRDKARQDLMLKSLLIYLYKKNKLSFREIAGQWGVTQSYIGQLLKRFNIKRRTISEATRGKGNELYADRKWLKEMYWKKGYSMGQMGEMLGCDRRLIWKWMNKLNVKRRQYTAWDKCLGRAIALIEKIKRGEPFDRVNMETLVDKQVVKESLDRIDKTREIEENLSIRL